MFRSLLSLVLDNSCYACNRNLTQQENWVCYDCLGNLPETNYHLSPTDNELYYRLAGKVPLSGAAGMYHFDKAGRLQKLIEEIKYKDALMLARYLGESYGMLLREANVLPADTCLLPVPLHWRKRWKRGYNQAEQIALGMSRALELPIENRLLRRKKYTSTQTRLSGAARWQNVSTAFQPGGTPPAHLILIDDIITTGATLEACIRSLMTHASPPQTIWVLALGVARKY